MRPDLYIPFVFILIITSNLGCGETDPSVLSPEVSLQPRALNPCGLATTYEHFGEGFMRRYCQGCHGTGTDRRYGAPPSVTFDTQADVITHRARIRARALASPPSMPPSGGITTDDQVRLNAWFRCDPTLQ